MRMYSASRCSISGSVSLGACQPSGSGSRSGPPRGGPFQTGWQRLVGQAHALLTEPGPSGSRPAWGATETLYRRARAFQSQREGQAWGSVRVIRDWDLLLLEQGLGLYLGHRNSPTDGYRLAVDDCAHYDPCYGEGPEWTLPRQAGGPAGLCLHSYGWGALRPHLVTRRAAAKRHLANELGTKRLLAKSGTLRLRPQL
jgi:hypothetical protein